MDSSAPAWWRAVVAGNPASPHIRDVWFYPADVAAHTGRSYRPGE